MSFPKSEFFLSYFCSKCVKIVYFLKKKKLYFISQNYPKDAVAHVQKYLMKNEVPVNLFEVNKTFVIEIFFIHTFFLIFSLILK